MNLVYAVLMFETLAIVEARMSSSRLPGKVMLPLGDGMPVIQLIVERLMQSSEVNGVCVATTTNSEDDLLCTFLNNHGFNVFRGSEDDVLERVLHTAKAFGAKTIVEVTGDCPFIDPEEVDYMIELLKVNDLDYIANNFFTSYADGFDIQVYYLNTLEKMSKMSLSKLEREHVTMKIRQERNLFKTFNLVAPKKFRRPNYSVTLDTEEDYKVIKIIYEQMKGKYGDNFGIAEVTDFLDKNPHVYEINNKVLRKGFT